MKKILAMFPGQGSQKVGMGKAAFDASQIARDLFTEADDSLGFSLSKLCFEGPEESLTRTAHAQPAILTVSTIFFRLAQLEYGDRLNIVAGCGHSLGEFSAYVAAGAISFADAVKLVNRRGSYMQEAVAPGLGKMVAVLAKEIPEIEAALAKVTSGVVQIANINAPGQVVLAGARTAVDEFVVQLGAAKVIELPVSAPFHCKLMQPAADLLAKDLEKLDLRQAKFPVYANYNALAQNQVAQIRQTLTDQVCGKVRWVECINNAVSQLQPDLAVEFGFGNVLTGLLKRIRPELTRKNVDSLEGVESLGL